MLLWKLKPTERFLQTPEWGEVKTDGSWTRDVLLVMSDNHEPVVAAMIPLS